MRPEQLYWTDEQWASHLECDARDVPILRQWMTENFSPGIGRDLVTGKYFFNMTRMDVAPSGAMRAVPYLSSDKRFESHDRARRYANEEVLPRLAFTTLHAQAMGVPERALQMLHIYDKQK